MNVLQVIRNTIISLIAPKNRAQGIDGAHWWGWFRPEQAKKAVDFIIVKATQGVDMTDSAFRDNMQGAMQIPVRGAYHYQKVNVSWIVQAEFFLRTVAPYDLHVYALDVEKAYNEGAFTDRATGDTFFSDMRRILDYWRMKNPGVRVVLYTNTDIYQNYIHPTVKRLYGTEGVQWLESMDLWLANYNGQGVDGEPTLPNNRTTPWKIWQHSSNGRKEDYGTNGDVDLNVFAGTVEDLQLWALGAYIPEPPPNGEPMAGKYFKLNTTAANIRNGPGASYADLGDLVRGDVVQVEEIMGNWSRIVDAQHLDGATVRLASGITVPQYTGKLWSTNAYFLEVAGLPNPPVIDPGPDPDPTITLKHTIKIYSNGSYQVDDGTVIP